MPVIASRRRAAAALVGLTCLAAPSLCSATEIRVGVGPSGHDLVFAVDDEGQEQGASVVADVVFDRAKALDFVGAPHPYIGGAVSLDDHTNFIQAGVLWRLEGQRVYGEFAAGLAVHDGETSLPEPAAGLSAAENARRARLREEQIAFGSRVLLHFGLAVGYRLTERWAVEVGTQHWSNAGLAGDDNDGSDVLNVRTAYRF